jgi:hypothetical protein
MKAQSPAEADANNRPAILGTLDKGKYSNRVIGFEIEPDPPFAIANEARAIEWTQQMPQRLNLTIRCGDDTVTLGSFPLYPDEQADLKTQAEPTLKGTIDSLGFKNEVVGRRQARAELKRGSRNLQGGATPTKQCLASTADF